MSILKDEKVVAAIAKESAKAVKGETKRILEAVKAAKDAAKAIENKDAKKVATDLLKALEADIKAAA